MLTNTLAPTVTYALTSGPTAPEATSFEPVDTTDMVNLQTGDLTYNVPLLEVPGPEGGYPLALSYHAGIQTNEDASWVGLGWSLNPGAITRSVNGYPDDWYAPQGTDHSYWVGGHSHTFEVGISIGIANSPATVGFGLSFSQDTYRGFGMGAYTSLGGRLGGPSSPFGASLKVGMDPYGGSYSSAGIGISGESGPFKGSVSIGFSINGESFKAGLTGTVGLGSAMEVSMSSSSSNPSYSFAGYSKSVSATKESGIQTSSSGFGLDIPIFDGINLSLAFSKTRYWTDEKTNVYTHGSLYSSGWGERSDNPYTHAMYDDQSFDTYSLLEEPSVKNIIDNPDPQKVQGGAFPDFDVYNVNAQGLGGVMRPYLFQGEVLGQNKKDKDGHDIVTYYSPGVTNSMPQFRFVGDFSNSYRQGYSGYSDPSANLRAVTDLPFDDPVYGKNDGSYGYNGSRLAGSKHIDLGVSVKPNNILGYNKADRYKSFMIDGFSITNESGITYHFGLPAYAWGEEVYQEKISQLYGLALNRASKPAAYAYTWYLTSITGPDFVDRDAVGSPGYEKANEGDWGYWVNFDYGKWIDDFVWRNPSEGYHRDEDNEWKSCSMGHKEVYYLNAIRTRSHTALFIKDQRADAYGANAQIFNKNSDNTYSNEGGFDANAKSLKLSKVLLLDNYYENTYGTNPIIPDGGISPNIYDVNDVALAQEAKGVRIIDFNYDGSLCKNTSNSSDGKLQLTSLVFRGKGGVALVPPLKFEYDLTGNDVKTASGTLSPSTFSSTSNNFEKGDLLSTNESNINSRVYCGVVTNKTFDGTTYTYTLKNGNYTGSSLSKELRTTKNPAYHKDAYDIWGMYKSDYDVGLIADNENAGRRTTPISSKSVDAWSLRKITSYLGTEINIKYESDVYKKSVLSQPATLIMKNIVPDIYRKTLQFELVTGGQSVQEFLNVGDKFRVFLFVPYSIYANVDGSYGYDYGDFKATLDYSTVGNLTINSISGTTVTAVLDNQIPTSVPYTSNPAFLTEDMNIVLTGNLILQPTDNNYGGGIRISSITASAATDQIQRQTSYSYSIANTSTGVTSYLPNVLEAIDVQAANAEPNESGTNGYVNNADAYRSVLYKDINSLLSMAREVVPPGVFYEYVTVSSQVKNSGETDFRAIEGSTQYQFEVFRENMVGRVDEALRTDNTTNWGHFTTHNLSLRKFTGSVGQLKSITQYDVNGKKLSVTTSQYLHDGLENLPLRDFMDQYKARLANYYYQGFLQERYAEVKVINEQGWNPNSQVMATLSGREEYPCISLGQTVTNYVNGLSTSIENTGFDFYSGAVTKTIETDGYGNRFMTEIKPAYQIANYKNDMGLKMNGGRNMLTQTAGTYVWKVDSKINNNNPLGLVSAEIKTWGNNTNVIDAAGNTFVQYINNNTTGNIWRIQSSFSWQHDTKTPNGLTALADFQDFNWTNPASSNAAWIKTAEVTLYDVNSKALEGTDVNGNYTATHMGYNNTKVVLSGSPAKYYEVAYSGAEDETVNSTNTGYIKKADGIVSTGTGVAHTGIKSLKLGVSGMKGFVYTVSTDKLVAGRSYLASVWVKPVSGTASDVKLYYEINGALQTTPIPLGSSAKTSGDWKLINMVISGSNITAGNTLTIGCRNDHATVEAYIDDMRIRPLNASSTAYVYDVFSGELTHVLDNNNWYTRFEYDAVGRLTKTYLEKNGIGEFKTSNNEYNYGKLTIFPSDLINQSYTRNNCPSGQWGTSVLINLPQGAINSVVSPDDANVRAQRYAQELANAQGSCFVPTVTLKLINNASASSFRAVVNDVSYNFSATGTTTFTVSPGTYTVQIAPIGGTQGTHSFTYVCGPDTQTITGTSADFGSRTVSLNSTIELTIN
jgi:YD repeat-containing protein